MPIPFERFLNIREAYQPCFSSDGRRLGFLADITGIAEAWTIETGSSEPSWPEQLTFGGERIASVTFSPVEDRLLISGDIGGSERTQLFLLASNEDGLRPLTNRLETIYTFGSWSPDGLRIVYSSNERDPRYFDIYEMELESGASKIVLRDDSYNQPGDYSPDGRFILVSRIFSNARNELLQIDIATGEVTSLTPTLAEGPALHLFPRWSADGSGIYLLCNQTRQFLSLAWLDLKTQEIGYLEDDLWDSVILEITSDGSRLAVVSNEDGYSRMQFFEVSRGWQERKSLPLPDLKRSVVRSLSWSPDGSQLALALQFANDTSDIWIWDLEKQDMKRTTRSATGGIPRDLLVEPSLIRYQTFDQREIPSFLYLPKGEHQENLPFVIYVHGGPEGQSRPVLNPVMQYLVNQGYGVLVPNVRGSSGYGYTYQSLDDVRLRMDSVADLRFGARWLTEQGVADPRRIGVMGGSYGGFMVLSALTTYPDLWAAGVDIVGIANFVTFLENTGAWRRKLREAEYGSLEQDREFLEQISPILHVDKIAAPLFVVHGANDPRVPVGEAEQIVAALKQRGVPTTYLRFEDEGHGLIKRVNRLVAYPAIARFLDQYVLQKPLAQ